MDRRDVTERRGQAREWPLLRDTGAVAIAVVGHLAVLAVALSTGGEMLAIVAVLFALPLEYVAGQRVIGAGRASRWGPWRRGRW